jgi:hypothetical protein
MLKQPTRTVARPILSRSIQRHRLIGVAIARMAVALSLQLCPVVTVAQAAARTDRLIVESNTPVTPPPGAHLNWYEMKADPENSQNLIVCGAMRNAQANAYVGVVYYSHDGGRSWGTAIEDRNSTWVSEQSCAFGSRHHAYFISEASKVVDGVPNHNLGTTRIFTSSDAGQTWAETAHTSWADYSSSAVRTSPTGADELYVFFNSGAEYDSSKRYGSTLGYFVVSDDGRTVGPHQIVPGMAEVNYQGVYPSAAVTMSDGSIVVLYNAGAHSPKKGDIPIEIGAVRFSAGQPSPPVIIADPAFRYTPPVCPSSLSTSLAYDRNRQLLYVAFNSVRAGRCSLMISKSNDGGRSWSPSHELRAGAESHSSKYFPVLAVTEEGVLGLQWRDRADLSPGCWYFSSSHDGLKIDSSVLLSPCSEKDSIKEQSTEYLATLINQPGTGGPITVQILTLRDYLTKVAITATPDGVFHPVWVESRNGNSELRTRRICISPSHSRSETLRVPTLSEVTDKMTILYAGEQRIDQVTGTVALNVAFQNHGAANLEGPLYLKVESMDSDFGEIKMASHPGGRVGDTGYFEIAGSDTVLAPGQRTPPYDISFRFTRTWRHPLKQYTIAEVMIRLFCEQRSSSAGAAETSGGFPSFWTTKELD